MERRTMIRSRAGYDIPLRYNIEGDEDKVLVMAHGFTSSKESPTVTMMMQKLPAENVGVMSFDFPAHGESPADGRELRLKNCISDLDTVAGFAKSKAPCADVILFGSSFGAYVALLYITEMNGAEGEKTTVDGSGIRAFFRSAAVNMPVLFDGEEGSSHRYSDMIVTSDFISDLRSNDLFTKFIRGDADLKMIHGTADEVIDYKKAEVFAEREGIELIAIKNGDHRLSIPGAPERVLSETVKFIFGR